jgi:hypothetical protein
METEINLWKILKNNVADNSNEACHKDSNMVFSVNTNLFWTMLHIAFLKQWLNIVHGLTKIYPNI